MAKPMMKPDRIVVTDGTTITFDVLEWREPAWEFDHPTCVVRPVVAYSPNGHSCEDLLVDLCERAAADGHIESEPIEDGRVDRLYHVASLRRFWGMARRGRAFEHRQYDAQRAEVRFFKSAELDGDLDFEVKWIEPTRAGA